MNARRLIMLAAAALVVAGAAVWVTLRGGPERASASQGSVLASLGDTLDAVNEVRLQRGDGTVTTLQRRQGGWYVAQRNYPADPGKLRSLLIGLSTLHAIEQKTSDPARYPALNVEDAAGAQSHSIRVDVVAGGRTWSLLLGKPAEPSGGYVRVAGAGAALLAQPRIEADPQPAHWIKSDLLELEANRVQQVVMRPAGAPSYSLTRDRRDAADLTLHGAPVGRKPAGPAVVDAVAGALARLSANDVRARTAGSLENPSHATFRTFEGLQLDVDGTREGGASWIRIDASVDPDTARRFAVAQAGSGNGGAEAMGAKADEAAKSSDAKSVEAPSGSTSAKPAVSDSKSADSKSADPAAEAAAINARVQGYDFQIPVYQYDAIYRQLHDLLAPKTEGAVTARSKERK
jgi:Domain of unknown function (DUF4340)